MSWLSFWIRLRPSRKAAARSSARPTLEALEERTLLNNRFVVPILNPVDGVNTFASLHDALAAPGLSPGDVIQIEPGATPGTITNADLPAVTNLTIQGDPAAGLAGTPQVTLADPVTIDGSRAGLTFRGVTLGLVGDGSLTFLAGGTLAAAAVVDVGSSAAAAVTLGGTGAVVRDSVFVNEAGGSPAALLLVNAVAGSHNLITGNSFTADAGLVGLVVYQAGSPTTVTDQVTGNTFTALQAPVNILFRESGPISGLVVRANSFQATAANAVAIQLDNGGGSAAPQATQIVGNAISLGGGGSTAVLVAAGAAGTTTSAVVATNTLDTQGAGIGLDVELGPDQTSVLNLKVQGNTFHTNAVGVLIDNGSATPTAPLAGIDLGGGSQHSLGGNNFHSFNSDATATTGAIVLHGVAAGEGTVAAERNLFVRIGTGPKPPVYTDQASVIFDPNGQVDSSNPLTDQAAFVETLYEDFLHRTGDTTKQSDAGGWVSYLLHGGSRAMVIGSIARSDEALGLVVDGLYENILGRAADAAGRKAFIAFLQHGGTVEQAVVALVTSAEFGNRTGSDVAFLQTLYTQLLGRPASTGELSAWLGGLPLLGRAGVAAAVVGSAEFRADVLLQLYGPGAPPAAAVAGQLPDLLHRQTVSAAELGAWVQSGTDVLTMASLIAGTPEFWIDG